MNALLRHFAGAYAASEPTSAQRKALEWLPEAMLFPAVSPGAQAQTSEEDGGLPEEADVLDEVA